MNNRWTILALLFGARMVMAFQFQSVAALSPDLMQVYGVGVDAIGFAFGLYMAPGLVVALPGAVLAQRINARAIVIAGMILMTIGAAIMVNAGDWALLLAGHALAGVGGVLLNVLMTRMVADWFAGRELTTALAVFVNSYPVGIALALILLPVVGLTAGLWISVALAAIATGAFALLYRSPANLVATGGKVVWGDRRDRVVAISSGAVWGLFNAGVALVFGLGPTLLIEGGMAHEAAGRLTSVIVISLAICGPFGGIVVDRFGNRIGFIAGCLTLLLATILAVPFLPPSMALFAVIGATAGFVAGPIMSLPAAALSPAARTTGMGLFFTLYYVTFVSAPVIAGVLSEAAGTTKAALYLGAACQCIALMALLVYRRAALRG